MYTRKDQPAMMIHPRCAWCDSPATHQQIERTAQGAPDYIDVACDEHTDQWLRPATGAVLADGSAADAPIQL